MMKKLLLFIFITCAMFSARSQTPLHKMVEQFTFDSTLMGTNGLSLNGASANYTSDRFGKPHGAHKVNSFNTSFGLFFAYGLTGFPAGNTDRTVSFWFKSDSNIMHQLFSVSNNPTTTAFAIYYNSGNLYVSNFTQSIQAAFPHNKLWNHVSVVHQSGITSIYINNNLINSGSITYSNPANPIYRVGASPSGFYNGEFSIDNIVIHSRGLSAQGVDSLYNACDPAKPVNTSSIQSRNVCYGTPASLSASGRGILYWFDQPSGGSVMGTGSTFTSPAIMGADTFYVQSGNEHCVGNRLAIPVATLSSESSNIEMINDVVRARNNFNNYKLYRDGVIVDSSNTTGNINFPAAQCGNYQATHDNNIDFCKNLIGRFYRIVSPCNFYIELNNLTLPATYSISYGNGSTPGAPNTTLNSRTIGIAGQCVVGQVIKLRIVDAGGCEYSMSMSIPNSPVLFNLTATSGNFSKTCKTFSNIVRPSSMPVIQSITSSSDTICLGQSTTITANADAGVSYQWSNNLGTNAQINVSPTATTTYEVTVTSGPNCTTTSTHTIIVKTPRTGIDVRTACESFTWINGQTYTNNNNTATHTIPGGGSNGCDSIITLNLTIKNPKTGIDVNTACGSFTWINGQTYTNSNNTATHTIPNGSANGCDSIITLNLTINNPKTGIDVNTACESFTWINGQTYTNSNNTATHTIPNGSTNGCDSIITLNLTIKNPGTSIDVRSACQIFTWIDGYTYEQSTNTVTYKIPGGSANGCDSIITLNLTIKNRGEGVDVQTACGSFKWINEQTYFNSNNTDYHIIPNGSANGCDSVVYLNLTINNLPNIQTEVNGNTIIAQQTNASYQWLDCSRGYIPISGATSRQFTASENGVYAVEVTMAGCIDTSLCTIVNVTGLNDKQTAFLKVYPNPANQYVNLENLEVESTIRIMDVTGKNVREVKSNNNNVQINISDLINGIYIIQIENQNGFISGKKLVVNNQ